MKQIALLLLLIGVAATTARAEVSVEKWHVYYTSAKSAARKADFAEFWIPARDGTFKFTTGISVTGPGADPKAKITADVTVARRGQELEISWETHDQRAGKSWNVKPNPVSITSTNKFEGRLPGGDLLYGEKV